MTAATVAPSPPVKSATRSAPVDRVTVEHRIALEEVPWEVYEALLDTATASGSNVRMNYDDGRLEIWMPGWKHEAWKKLLAGLLELMLLELSIEWVSAGSLTIKEKLKRKGCEPDECYFIQHEQEVRHIEKWIGGETPPPDLAIEAEDANSLVPRLPILAGLGVPEIWRFDGEKLEALELRDEGEYHMIDRSLALPFLQPRELAPFVLMRKDKTELEVKQAFRRWVRERFADRIASPVA